MLVTAVLISSASVSNLYPSWSIRFAARVAASEAAKRARAPPAARLPPAASLTVQIDVGHRLVRLERNGQRSSAVVADSIACAGDREITNQEDNEPHRLAHDPSEGRESTCCRVARRPTL